MHEFDPSWIEKLNALREKGVNPYPNGLVVTHTSTELHKALFGVESEEALGDFNDVSIGGRVMFRNKMGRAMFLRIQDRGGPEVLGHDETGEPIVGGGVIQVYARREILGDEAFALLKGMDIGDIYWIRGGMMRTKTGELTIKATEVCLASKALSTFPDRWNSVKDVQTRSRQREVDLFMNAEAREVFRTRSAIIRNIREFFEAREFLEVETPMMHVIPGGATARPFVTHHNTLDMDLYLRVAPELFLKRLVVGGFERVFEINRSFRNEGISTKHNPEFTTLEFYQAWATYSDLMDLFEELIVGLVEGLHGKLTIELGSHSIDFQRPWRREDMDVLIGEHTGLSRAQLEDPSAVRAYWLDKHPEADESLLPGTRGKWWDLLFGEYVEPNLVNPTFVTGYPVELSPLSRRQDNDPSRVDRFELVVGTWELVNAFSELNDPVDQAGRFASQAEALEQGDEESMHFDHDYVRALSRGMPPTAGAGLGIDRLVMVLTGKTSIREVILFPTMRPESENEDSDSSKVEG